MNFYGILTKTVMLGYIAFSAQGGEILQQKSQSSPGFGKEEYRLGPEDVVEIFVWKEPDLSRTVVVRPDGKISMPLITELEASGKTAAQLQTEITTKLRQLVTDPVVNVIVKEVNSPKISILGEVHKPGVYSIKNKITVLDSIALAGGFTEFAKRDKVIVLRNGSSGQQRVALNLKRLLKESGGEVFYLEPFDTVYVE